MSDEVIVVGGGPAGLLTALGLALEGVKVTVLEAEDDLSSAPRAMVYHPSTVVALERLGLLPDLEKIAIKGYAVGFHVPEFAFKAVVSIRSLEGVTHGYQLHCGQDKVARVAMEHAQRLGVTIKFNHRVTGLEQDESGVTLSADTPEGPQTYRAGWVVGADGARSTVRSLLGIEFEGMTWDNRFVATNFYCDCEALGFETANVIADPVYAAIIAKIDGEGLWRLTYQEAGDLPDENFMDRLPERYAGILGPDAKYEVATARRYTIHQRAAARFREGRVLLVGDASHATNPTGGMGLTTGVWDAAICADVLAAVIRKEERESILDAFAAERRRVFWEVSSASAVENKRIQEETDPVQRRKDMENIRHAADNPEIGRLVMAFPFRAIGDTLRKGSRWADADPTPRFGIDLSARGGQLK